MSGEFPEVRYADSDGVSIAYEVRGVRPLDVVLVPSAMASLMARRLIRYWTSSSTSAHRSRG
jgi:hypothetical protein